MIQERKLIFLSFFFVFTFNAVHAEESTIKQSSNTLKFCSENIELKKLTKIINNIHSNWDKKFINDIHDKSVILFQTDSNYILFANQLKTTPALLNKLIDTPLLKKICRSQINNDVPYIVLKKESGQEFEDERLFYFVYSNNNKFNELISLSQFFKRILLINSSKSDHITNDEIELTIAHEAIHLFSQDDIFDDIPPLRFENILFDENTQLIHENIILENEKCNFELNEISKYTNREYLDFKFRCLPKFKELIQKETCLDKELIHTITNRHEDINYSRFHATIILIEIFKVLREKNNLYKDNNLALEWYWYLAEGVPQYFEQKILMQRKSARILNNYDRICSLKNNTSGVIFYPLLTGAAIWHGLEFLHDSESEWGNLAVQSTENIPTSLSSENWIDNWLLMLENQLIRINLN